MEQQAVITDASVDTRAQFQNNLQLLEAIAAKTNMETELSPVYANLTTIVRQAIVAMTKTKEPKTGSDISNLPEKLGREERDLLLAILLSAESVPVTSPQEIGNSEITAVMDEIADTLMEEGFVAMGYENPRNLVWSVVEYLMQRLMNNDEYKLVQSEIARQTNVPVYYVDKILRGIDRSYHNNYYLFKGKNLKFKWSYGFYLEETAALAEGEDAGSGI